MDEDGLVMWPAVCGNGSRKDAFWDPQVTLNTSSPGLTRCFQATVLVWAPCAMVWVILPFYSIYLRSLPSKHPWSYRSKFNITKIVLCVLLVAVGLADLFRAIQKNETYSLPPVVFISPSVRALTFACLAVVTSVEFNRGVHSSGPQFIAWLLFLICGIIRIKTDAGITERTGEQNFFLGTSILYFILVVVQFILSLFVDKKVFAVRHKSYTTLVSEGGDLDEKAPLLGNGLPVQIDGEKTASIQGVPYEDVAPESRASFLSNITYAWFTSILFRGYRKPLKPQDVFAMMEEDHSHVVMEKFDRCWQKELETTGEGKKPSLPWALAKCAGFPLVIGSFCRLVCLVFDFLNPVLLRVLIAYVSGPLDYAWKGFLLATALLANNLMQAILMQAQNKLSCFTGQRLRMAVTTAVYRKILRLSSAARREVSAGQIVNLMSVDAQKMQDSCFFFASAWTTPVILVVCLVFIWQTVGPSSMASLIVLFIIIPVNVLYVGRRSAQLQREQMKEKDNRIKIVNEILAGIKVLKFYAWEGSFQDKVMESRDRELKPIGTALNLSAISTALALNIPMLIMLCIFSVFTMTSTSNILDADKAFVTLSLVSLMIQPLSTLPIFIINAVQAFISMKRIAKFLTLPEIDPESVIEEKSLENAIVVSDATLRWTDNSPPILKNLDVTVGRGQLVAVVGQVGAGKSSLISTVLGELAMDQGQVAVGGDIAYVPQQAWMQNASLRDNITFGKSWDGHLYHKVLEACALVPDLKMLPGGDQTEIGEKGINLSGGQKQRVSLARAVYSQRDIFLLDDPLSAVDAHVGKHIFEHVIGPGGMLASKTRVLVTHAVTYLPQVDLIIVLKDGEVSESGTYQELLDQCGAFADFLQNHALQDNDGEEVSEEDAVTSPLSAGSGTEPDDLSQPKTLRKRSSVSRKSVSSIQEENKSPAAGSKLIEEEIAEVGSIKAVVIQWYVKSGGVLVTVFTLLALAAFAAVSIFANIWLSAWTADPTINGTLQDREQTEFRLGVYGGLAIGQLVATFINSMLIAYGCVSACRAIHNALIKRIMRAPMSFFDTTPVGRILNRFAKDMDILDNNIPVWLRLFMISLPPVLSTLVVISYSTPIFLSVVVPLAIIYFLVQKVYIASVRHLKRLDSIMRSPIYAHFDESLVGITSIRAYKQENRFTAKSDRLVDQSQRMWYNIVIAQRWVGFWLQVLGSMVVFFASMFAVLERENITGGLVGMSVSYSLQVTQMLNMMVRSSTELETYIVAVERIKEYSEIATEAPWAIPGARPDRSWPRQGDISLQDYSTRYRTELDLVLHHLTCNVRPNEKVGVVGRTGAGKTSLTLALFRLIEPAAGSINIDQVNICEIGLHDLRSKLSIIPQDPVVFSGSLRDNLDPFSQYPDSEIWRALEQAHLKRFVEGSEHGLQYDCGEGGEALSVGQRQLVCLARALLRQTKILVLDEATAAVDLETDELIQNTIRTEFKDCTVITIAHRLNTVLDYDRVMVLDKGKIEEFESPATLLKKKDSIFYGMAHDAGLV